jgi:4-diphosphocytidyl-2C-methyl-D-erythritol kinase
MTGSGSAYFAVADNEAEATRWTEAARAAGADTHVARLLVDGNEQQEKTS